MLITGRVVVKLLHTRLLMVQPSGLVAVAFERLKNGKKQPHPDPLYCLTPDPSPKERGGGIYALWVISLIFNWLNAELCFLILHS